MQAALPPTTKVITAGSFGEARQIASVQAMAEGYKNPRIKIDRGITKGLWQARIKEGGR